MDIKTILAGIALILLCYITIKYLNQIYDFWKKRGVPTYPGALPILGHTLSIFLFNKTFATFCEDVYRKNKDCSMIGFFQLRKPCLLLRDPELIKTVLASQFPKFQVNFTAIAPDLDPLLARNPFFNSGEKWKEVRNHLTYGLMSGKRLRIICHSIARVCDKFTGHLRDNIARSKNGAYEIEMKELSNRFTGEVVANAGFGVEGDFFINGIGPNSFRESVEGFMDPTFLNSLQQSVFFFFPLLAKIFRFRLIPMKMDFFFRRLIHEMIQSRINDPAARRNDFLQLMLDSRKDENGKIDEMAVTASATSFFVDGYETSAITLSFFAYQLAENPEIQEKLRKEVRRVLESHNGEINYESLNEMTYMDKALNESMRYRLAVGLIMKRCNERCKLIGDDGIECIVEPDMEILIPAQAIQNDPKYWEKPDVYDPERFNDDSKVDRPKMVYLPFGEGPRMCPGMRFATLQIKGAIATILKDFSLEVSPKTKRPLKVKRGSILTAIEGGLWIKFKPL